MDRGRAHLRVREVEIWTVQLKLLPILLFFSFHHHRHKDRSCAHINWFINSEDMPDPDTGMWTVHLECDHRRQATVQVIAIDSIVRGAHLLPVYVVDHHAHRLISSYYNFLLEFRSFAVSRNFETAQNHSNPESMIKLPFIDELVPEICDRTSFFFCSHSGLLAGI